MHRNRTGRLMSLVGQSRPKCDVRLTSALLLIATEQRTSHHVSDGPILLQKSFCVLDHKISEPWARFSSKHVRGHMLSQRTHQ